MYVLVVLDEFVALVEDSGSGKSTLLKILSRITDPTEGRAIFRGRVGSLLEVGTGFHPELTGRENIFLNGALMGMRRTEIRANFDAIVDFAGIDKFLDTPVKRYSSGMYVRLAFAVAAHLEPEILVVDSDAPAKLRTPLNCVPSPRKARISPKSAPTRSLSRFNTRTSGE
jgi:lipopolysaccharide transport system ATP-binding protein